MADPYFSKRKPGNMSASKYDPDGDGRINAEPHTHTISDVTNLQSTLNTKLTADQAAAVADSSGATDTVLESKVNELLAALRAAGIMA